MDCLFCKIINKEIPSTVVYEDERVFAILDINPIAPGHALLMPKTHSKTMLEADDADLAALALAVKKLAPAICVAAKCEGWNLRVNNGSVAGQLVDHTHWHVIPRHADDSVPHWPRRKYAEGEAAEVAAKIRANLA
jgi:histidine triad (HIT) family protein